MKEFVQFTWEKTNEFYYPNVDHDDDGDDSDAGHSVRGAGKQAWFVGIRKQIVIRRLTRWRRHETLRQLILLTWS